MSNISRREVVRVLGGVLGAGALAAVDSSPARAQVASSGFLNEQHAQDVIASLKPAVVLLEVETNKGMAWGTGFFISSDGTLITCKHVVEGAQKITCILKNKDKVAAKVVKVDDNYDLAIVKADAPKEVATAALGDSEAISEGLLVAVTGYPAVTVMVWMGMALDSSTSRGSLNGLRFGGDANTLMGDQVLQIDAPATHGNSGGPVFRLDTGEVIGVLMGSLTGVGNAVFAVPVNPAKALVAAASVTMRPRVLASKSAEAVVEPGDLRSLTTIGVDKQLPPLFGMPFPGNFDGRSNKLTKTIDEWYTVTGQWPDLVTPLTMDGDEVFFGAADGKLRKWNLAKFDNVEVLLDATEDGQIFIFPPVVNDQIICAVAGNLDLDQRTRFSTNRMAMNVLGRITGGIFGGGGLTEEYAALKGCGTLYGLNRHNGNVDWEVQTGFLGSPLLYDNKIFYGGIEERGCLDAYQGTEIWKIEDHSKGSGAVWRHVGYAGPEGVYAVVAPIEAKTEKDGKTHMVGNGKAVIEFYDVKTGAQVWAKPPELGDIKGNPYPLNTAMFVDTKKRVVYAMAGQIIMAADAGTGSVKWVYDPAGKTQDEAEDKNKTEDKNKAKDKNKPKEKARKAPNFTGHMVIVDGIIYVGSEDRKLHAINGETGETVWVYQTRGPVGRPTHHEGQILVGSQDGYIHVVDARTGELNWRVRTAGGVSGQPLVHTGMVCAATDRGEFHTVRFPVA